jgi:hypothetical protein
MPWHDLEERMPVIQFPMSPGGGWCLVALYSDYAKRVRQNLNDEKPFEAVALSCLCLDVLLHHMLDGLNTHHKTKLDAKQVASVRRLQQGRRTSGEVIASLSAAGIFDRRLLRALKRLNEVRNLLVHPVQGERLKPGAIVPIGRATGEHKEYARSVYRLLCHLIDLAGGSSPRRDDRYQGSFTRALKQWQQQKGRAGHP